MKGKKGLTVLFTVFALMFLTVGLYGCAKKPAQAPAKKKAKTKTTVSAKASTAKTASTKTVSKSKVSAKGATSGKLETAAMKIINGQGCLGCHTINGKGGKIGPNLSKEGSKGHSVKWIEVQINTPKKHDPSTMMPNHNLNASQLKTVAEYLDSLK